MREPIETLQELKMTRLLSFFIPLGISASLTNVSHVIINSTLARSSNPELVIASYAIALSILGLTERPALLLRQTCSALIKDRESFRSMFMVTMYLILSIFAVGILISYTTIGKFLFLYILGIDESLLQPTLHVYQILMLVSIFSGIRCLYQGIIISNMKTKWLTIGMIFRLTFMYLLSLYYIKTNQVNSGQVGAIIFLVGMVTEAAISYIEGRLLLKKMPKKIEDKYQSQASIFKFFRPLLYSAFITILIAPTINAFLGKTTDIKLAIASFAIATSVTHLVIGFFSYIHQIVLNFHTINKIVVFRFTLIISLMPCALMILLTFTPIGPWFFQTVMGTSEHLMEASLNTLRVFIIMTLIFPWLDYCNGLIILKGQTKVMVWSQSANLCTTILILFVCIALNPGWNGMIGAFAMSLGLASEVGVLFFVLKRKH